MTIYAFTSIAANYVPKARVLAESVKALNPDVRFCLVVAEPAPEGLAGEVPAFDEIITLDQLGIPDLAAWTFKHSIVEICTAVKGFLLCQLLERPDCEAAFYFDPDMAVFSELTALTGRFGEDSVLLTPHLAAPEKTLEAVRDNEIAALKHGVYNLGFLGVRNSDEGRRFAEWWCDRLEHFCYDDIPNGIFTDQRWVDLAPALFTGIRIVRDPGWNVATWNITHRDVAGSFADGFTVNGEPLRFYHFSGFDSGAQYAMLRKYGKHQAALFALRDWYIERCAAAGAERYGPLRWCYACYDNGASITGAQRRLYRLREDLQRAFPDPFSTSDINRSYYDWYRVNHDEPPGDPKDAEQAQLLAMYKAELESIHASRAWKAVSLWRRLRHALRRESLSLRPVQTGAAQR